MSEQSKVPRSNEATGVLTSVNRLLSEAADLLTESHAPTAEGFEAEREVLQHITRAGKVLMRERQRQSEGQAVCEVPGCERPRIPGDRALWCKKHQHHWDARAEVEAWEHARSILEPWVTAAREIGSDELTRVMEEALAGVDVALGHARENLELAEARLDQEEVEPENGGGHRSCA